jgi:hypothetical protein
MTTVHHPPNSMISSDATHQQAPYQAPDHANRDPILTLNTLPPSNQTPNRKPLFQQSATHYGYTKHQSTLTTFISPPNTTLGQRSPANNQTRKPKRKANKNSNKLPTHLVKTSNKPNNNLAFGKTKFITDAIQPTNLSNPEANFPTWGHALESIDSTSTLRLILQDPNGLKTYDPSGELFLNLQSCSSIGAGILCLPEINTNWNHQHNKAGLQNALKLVWKHSTHQTSSSAEIFHSDYQPGRTATVVLDRWTS